MAEETQVQQVTMKEPQQVTMKNPKKVEVGKRLAEYNRRKREVKKGEVEPLRQYYGIGVVLAVGVIGSLGHNLYQVKKAQQPSHPEPL